MQPYDVIVVGLGAMGSATLYQLARRGARVLGIDRFAPPHRQGSSHGETRVTRLAIGEGAHYSPLVLRSHAIWREIEGETGADLLSETGLLVLTNESDSEGMRFFEATVAAAELYGIEHELLLGAVALRVRYRQLAVSDGDRGYLERRGGFVRPEACVEKQLELARRLGAEVRFGVEVEAYESTAGEGAAAVVTTTGGGRFEAAKVVLAAGAWIPGLLRPGLARHFKVCRQVLFWFDTAGADEAARFGPEQHPVFLWFTRRNLRRIYGFPDVGGGVKIATHQYDVATTADGLERRVGPGEVEAFQRDCVAPNLPGLAAARCVRSEACVYTLTPDHAFVLDWHPDHPGAVFVASPCSGHGFKHSAAIGEALALTALGLDRPYDLSAFRFDRFGTEPPAPAVAPLEHAAMGEGA